MNAGQVATKLAELVLRAPAGGALHCADVDEVTHVGGRDEASFLLAQGSDAFEVRVSRVVDGLVPAPGKPRIAELRSFGRNRFVLELDVELTRPLGGPGNGQAKEAAELLAEDVFHWLRSEGWGFGVARVQSVYAPPAQWERGDYVPEGSRA